MMMETVLSRTMRAMYSGGLVVGTVLIAHGARAQDAADTAAVVTRVEITGSSIRRIAQEGALPVQLLNRADIERSGATSVAELMEKIPAMQGFTEASSSVGGGGLGLSTANLHSIGSSRTLVLLNGRRLATSGQQSLTGNNAAINLNTIPLAAVERVEILTDGASAIYGSDAIGGVLNFILRRDFQGAEASAGAFLPNSGAKEKNFNVTLGAGSLANDGYNVMLAAAHDTRTPLRASDRSFAATRSKTFTERGRTYTIVPTSSYSSPANFESNEGEFRGLRNPYYEANKTCPTSHVVRENTRARGTFYCAYDPQSALEIYPEMERDTVLLSGQKALVGDAVAHASIVYGQSTVRSVRAAPPPDVTVAPDSPFYGPVAALGYTGEVNARWRALDAGGRTVEYVDKAYQFSTGVKGSAMGWEYSADYNRSASRADQNLITGNLTARGLDRAISAGTINPFAAPGAQSAAGLRTLQQIQAQGYYSGGISTLDQIALQGSRPLATLAGGDLQLGTGISFLRDRVRHKPSALAQTQVDGGLADELTSEVPTDVSRRSVGAFAELLAPLTRQLELTTAVRADRYSDFSSTSNYKLGLRYTPTKSLMVRAALGTGFHAPTAGQLSNIRQIAGETDFHDCPFVAPDPRRATCNGSDIYKVFEAGNPALKPETSRQWSAGIRFEPSPMMSVGLDMWNVDIRDRIGGSPRDEDVFADPARYARYFTTFIKNGKPELALLYPNENGGDEHFRGVDLDARFRIATPLGRVTTSAYGTYMISSERQNGASAELRSDLGHSDGLGNVTLRFIGNMSATLDSGKFAHTLTATYKHGYDETVTTVEDPAVERRVSALTVFDWQTRYKLSGGITLVAGVYNLFDKEPPFSGSGSRGAQANYNNTVASPRGRSLMFNATIRY